MCPSDEDLANAMEQNGIKNNTFTHRDVINARKIFGPSEKVLKRKTIRKKSKLPREDTTINIPSAVIDQFKKWTTLLIDMVHANKVSFLMSKANYLNYYQCIPIWKKWKEYILDDIEKCATNTNNKGYSR